MNTIDTFTTEGLPLFIGGAIPGMFEASIRYGESLPMIVGGVMPELAPPTGPPVIRSSLVASGRVGQAFNYTIAARGARPITFNATGLPAGLTFATPRISGIPTAAAVTNITLDATNAEGSDSKTLVLTVAAAPPGGGGVPVGHNVIWGSNRAADMGGITGSAASPLTETLILNDLKHGGSKTAATTAGTFVINQPLTGVSEWMFFVVGPTQMSTFDVGLPASITQRYQVTVRGTPLWVHRLGGASDGPMTVTLS
jgi:hypothetical protein